MGRDKAVLINRWSVLNWSQLLSLGEVLVIKDFRRVVWFAFRTFAKKEVCWEEAAAKSVIVGFADAIALCVSLSVHPLKDFSLSDVKESFRCLSFIHWMQKETVFIIKLPMCFDFYYNFHSVFSQTWVPNLETWACGSVCCATRQPIIKSVDEV